MEYELATAMGDWEVLAFVVALVIGAGMMCFGFAWRLKRDEVRVFMRWIGILLFSLSIYALTLDHIHRQDALVIETILDARDYGKLGETEGVQWNRER